MTSTHLNNAEFIDTKKSKVVLVLIILISVCPIALAYFVYFTGIGIPSSTVNHGNFVDNPISLERYIDSRSWKHWKNQKKWRLIIPISSECDNSCINNINLTRQVHIRLNQTSNRLERVLLVAENTLSPKQLNIISNANPLLKMAGLNIERFDQVFNNGCFYLVDQEGRLVMQYDSSQTGNELLADLKRAIKYSIDYQQYD